jgi:hypothetical protein
MRLLLHRYRLCCNSDFEFLKHILDKYSATNVPDRLGDKLGSCGRETSVTQLYLVCTCVAEQPFARFGIEQEHTKWIRISGKLANICDRERAHRD